MFYPEKFVKRKTCEQPKELKSVNKQKMRTWSNPLNIKILM